MAEVGYSTQRKSLDGSPDSCGESGQYNQGRLMRLNSLFLGRAVASCALAFAAAVQLCGATLRLPVMIVCGFLLGGAGQVVKLCADTAMQIDVDDALRGHVFTVQDALFWMAFIVAIAAAAFVIPADGHAPGVAIAGTVLYLMGLAVYATVARRSRPAS